MKILPYLLVLNPVIVYAGEWQKQPYIDPYSQKPAMTYYMSARNESGRDVVFTFQCDTVVRTFAKQSGPAYLEQQGMYDTFSLKLDFPNTDFKLYEPVSVRVGWKPKWRKYKPKSFMPASHNTLYYRDVFTQYVIPSKGSASGSFTTTPLGNADRITVEVKSASGGINETWQIETPGIRNVVYDMSNTCNAVNGYRASQALEANMSVQLRKNREYLDRQWDEYINRFNPEQRGPVLLQYNQQQAVEREQRKQRIRFFDNQDNWGYPSRY